MTSNATSHTNNPSSFHRIYLEIPDMMCEGCQSNITKILQDNHLLHQGEGSTAGSIHSHRYDMNMDNRKMLILEDSDWNDEKQEMLLGLIKKGGYKPALHKSERVGE